MERAAREAWSCSQGLFDATSHAMRLLINNLAGASSRSSNLLMDCVLVVSLLGLSNNSSSGFGLSIGLLYRYNMYFYYYFDT